MLRYLFLALIMLSIEATGQTIYKTQNKAEANIKIYFTEKEYEANWCVKITNYKSSCGNGIWFYTKWKNQADLVVYVTTNRWEADKIVYVTDYNSKIKWIR